MSGPVERPGPQAQIAGLVFAVILIDRQLSVMEVNPAAEDLLGQSAKRLVGRSLFDLLDFGNPYVEARLREDGAPVVARGLALAVGGRSLKANLTVSPMPSHPGWRVVTLSEAGQDDVGERPEDAGFLSAPAVLAHEIKNPLSAIRGAGQLLARKLDGKDAALAALITGEVDRIASLVDRMQRLGSRTAEPLAPLNLHEAVRNALSTIRSAGLGNADLVEEFDPSLPPVLGNRAALEQVLINLVSNARDACAGNAGGTIAVRTRFVTGLLFNAVRTGKSVRLPIELTVSDNGPGIPPDMREHVFEPFVTTKPHGQGLGLAIVRKLVRDMGGRIAHDRDERAGLTHFRLHLPLARQDPR
ncbi:MAG: two-component system sensor histidine kinase NtrB [Tsuneonella sp.]